MMRARSKATCAPCIPKAEAVFTDPDAVAFAFVDSVGAKGAWDKLNEGLSRGDQLSVLELGEQIVPSSGVDGVERKDAVVPASKTVANPQRDIWLVGL